MKSQSLKRLMSEESPSSLISNHSSYITQPLVSSFTSVYHLVQPTQVSAPYMAHTKGL